MALQDEAQNQVSLSKKSSPKVIGEVAIPTVAKMTGETSGVMSGAVLGGLIPTRNQKASFPLVGSLTFRERIGMTSAFRISRVKTYIKSVFFAVLCVGILFGNFLWEESTTGYGVFSADKVTFSENKVEIPGYAYFVADMTVGSVSEASETAVSGDGEIAAVLGDSIPGVESVLNLATEKNGEYVFTMKDGRIWGNFDRSISKVNIQIGGKIVVIPSFSDFDLTYQNGVVTLDNFEGITYVGFLSTGSLGGAVGSSGSPEGNPRGVAGSSGNVGGNLGGTAESAQYKFTNEYDDSFDNVLLVPAGIEIKIPLSRVDSRLTQLLYSKLAKEFSYSAIQESKYSDAFVKKNLSDSLKFSEGVKESLRDEFKGFVKDNANLSSSVSEWLSKNLTVFDNKVEERYAKKLDSYIYEAFLAEDSSSTKDLFDKFLALKSELPQSMIDNGYYKKFLEKGLSKGFVFGASDSESEVFDFLVTQAWDYFDKFYLVNLKLGSYGNDIYLKKNIGTIYESVYKLVEKLFGKSDEATYKKFLSYSNQIFDNLIFKFPELYKLKYFEMKSAMEKELFGLYYAGQLKDELKQSFVSQKISSLRRLKYFFFDEKVDISDAREVMKYLIESINDYMPAKTSKNAVIGLFEEELKDIGDFWGYINNAEYSKSSLYGETQKERYDVYLKEKDQVTTILDVQREILGSEVIVEVTPVDVVAEIKKNFESVSAKDVFVEDITDVHKRFVKVAAVISGYAFNADYDREYGYVKNIYAYGQKLTDSSVKLSMISDFLTKKLASVVKEVAPEAGVSTTEGGISSTSEVGSANSGIASDSGTTGNSGDSNSGTNAQKIAKTIIAKEVSEAGFVAAMENVDIIDPINAIYRLNDIKVSGTIPGGGSISISFDYSANDANVKNIFVTKDGKGTSLTGEFPLKELSEVVTSEHY